jgi:hypothetical protein
MPSLATTLTGVVADCIAHGGSLKFTHISATIEVAKMWVNLRLLRWGRESGNR